MNTEWKKRAFRTFAQVAIGTIAANLTASLSGVSDGKEVAFALLSVLTTAVATGLAAVMNMGIDDEED